MVSYGAMFRNHNSNHVSNFSCFLGHGNALFIEFICGFMVMEYVISSNWQNFWLEFDFMLVVNVITKSTLVPWKIRNKWDKCILGLKSNKLFVTHIYRECNNYVYTLANLGLTSKTCTWCNDIHTNISKSFNRNLL